MKPLGVLVLSQLLFATTPIIPARTPTAVVPAARHIIDGIPFLRQGREYCGPATLAMVFGYYRVSIPQEELAEEIYRKNLDGTLNLDMLIAARRHGFDAAVPEGSSRLLKEYIRQEVPVIVLIETAADPPRFHYLVIYGYDDQEEEFHVHSGRNRAGTISYRNFIPQWEAAGHWMLVIEQKKNF